MLQTIPGLGQIKIHPSIKTLYVMPGTTTPLMETAPPSWWPPDYYSQDSKTSYNPTFVRKAPTGLITIHRGKIGTPLNPEENFVSQGNILMRKGRGGGRNEIVPGLHGTYRVGCERSGKRKVKSAILTWPYSNIPWVEIITLAMVIPWQADQTHERIKRRDRGEI